MLNAHENSTTGTPTNGVTRHSLCRQTSPSAVRQPSNNQAGDVAVGHPILFRMMTTTMAIMAMNGIVLPADELIITKTIPVGCRPE